MVLSFVTRFLSCGHFLSDSKIGIEVSIVKSLPFG
jgi:hypothetical protein